MYLPTYLPISNKISAEHNFYLIRTMQKKLEILKYTL